jgi:hypothetical protein
MKIVINSCYGGFSLSKKAIDRLRELKLEFDYDWQIERNNPKLVQVVEELGALANGSCAKLKIVEIPDDVEWEIEEYDGSEWVGEKHRTWR